MKRLKVIKIILVILAVSAFGYGLLSLGHTNAFAQDQKPTPVSQPTTEPTSEPTSKPDPPAPDPTQAPDKPQPKPTQAPDPSVEPTAEPTPIPEKPTVAPTKPVVDATPTPASPEKPVSKPTPTPAPLPGGPESPGPGKAPPEPTPLPEPGESAPVSSEPPADGNEDGNEGGDEEKAQDALVVSVHVFDDRDKDGVRGVPVLLDGVVIGATDTDGRFALPLDEQANDRATLSIDPPSGWRWDGAPVDIPDVLATGRADFPLTREASSERSVSRDTGASPSLTTTLALLIALTFVGVGSLVQAGSARSLAVAYRRQMAQSLEWQQDEIIEQRRREAEQALRDTGDWRGILRQVLVDALPEIGAGDVSAEVGNTWLAPVDVGVSPARFAVARQAGEADGDKRYTFTTSPRISLINRWRKRVITLDAALSPSVRVEVEAVWRYLLQKREVDAVAVLPRRAEWYLVIERHWLK